AASRSSGPGQSAVHARFRYPGRRVGVRIDRHAQQGSLPQMIQQNVIGLLEDDEDQSRLLSHWLVDAGYQVRLYPSSAEFRRKQGAASVDLWILDWNLPDESGLSILRSLRDAGSEMPVLFLTARSSEDDIVTGLREGADDYVSKPATQRELLARVGALLRR